MEQYFTGAIQDFGTFCSNMSKTSHRPEITNTRHRLQGLARGFPKREPPELANLLANGVGADAWPVWCVLIGDKNRRGSRN